MHRSERLAPAVSTVEEGRWFGLLSVNQRVPEPNVRPAPTQLGSGPELKPGRVPRGPAGGLDLDLKGSAPVILRLVAGTFYKPLQPAGSDTPLHESPQEHSSTTAELWRICCGEAAPSPTGPRPASPPPSAALSLETTRPPAEPASSFCFRRLQIDRDRLKNLLSALPAGNIMSPLPAFL